MDIELQADRPVHTEITIRAHVLQKCRAEVHREKQQLLFFFLPCGGTLCNRLKLEIRAERWLQTKAAL